MQSFEKEYVGNLSVFIRIFLAILLVELLIIAVLFFTSGTANAQVIGQDLLAAQSPKFKGSRILPYLPDSNALGSLNVTFGTSLAPVRSLLSSGKFKFYRVHLVNGTCITNQNCGSYEPFPKDTNKTFEAKILKKDRTTLKYFATQSALYCALRAEYPLVQTLISPVLEHHLGTAAYRIIANEVLKACPGVQLVNNPVTGKGERYQGAWIESHATTVPADIYSFDGQDATDANIPKWLNEAKNAKIAYIWTRSYNCRASGGGWVDPRQRNNCPTDKTLELAAHLAEYRPLAPAPTFSCKFKPFKEPNIWKPLAEDYPNVNDARANLPVAIVPFGKTTTTVRAVNGKLLGNLTYFGVYQGTLNRYYSGTGSKLSGYDFEKKAVAEGHSPWIYLRQGNNCIGPYVPGRRAGAFR